jgi:arsenite oxidase small subunit
MSEKLSRRHFFKISGGLAAGAGLAATAIPNAAQAAPVADAGGTVLPYPRKPLGAAARLKVGEPVSFTFPDAASPCTLVKMGGPVEGGVGPDRDIVAYSSMCTHMGCPVAYDSKSGCFKCPCHYSTFDAEKGGQLVCGQATEKLPRIVLQYDAASGDVTAVAIEGLIYGRQSNIL